MAHTRLSDDEVQAMLDKAEAAKRTTHTTASTHIDRWPRKEDYAAITNAVEEEEDEVTLTVKMPGSEGRTKGVLFKIDYLADRDDAVFLSPAEVGVFVPCGLIRVDRLG